jgi:hypothetical protein
MAGHEHKPKHSGKFERIRPELGAGSTKLDYSFYEVPVEGQFRVSSRFRLGKSKYGLNNWKNGNAMFVLERMNHVENHWMLFKRDGNKYDDNLGAVLWGLYVLCWYETNRPSTYNAALDMIQGDKVHVIVSEEGRAVLGQGPRNRSGDRRGIATIPGVKQGSTGYNRGGKRSNLDRATGNDNRGRNPNSRQRDGKVTGPSTVGQQRNQDQRTSKRKEDRKRNTIHAGRNRDQSRGGGPAKQSGSGSGQARSKLNPRTDDLIIDVS